MADGITLDKVNVEIESNSSKANNGIDKLTIFSIPVERQYNYIDGITCITFGILYENSLHL